MDRWTNGWTDRRTNGWIDSWMDEWTDMEGQRFGSIDGCINIFDGWMSQGLGGQKDGWTEGEMNGSVIEMDGYMDGQTDSWIDRWMDRLMDGRMKGQT